MTGITFLIVFLILITLVAVVPQLLKKFHIPSVVAIMIVGIIIGPNSLNLIYHLNHFLGRGYPTQQIYVALEAFGLLGLIFLMALAGMEVNLRIIMLEKKAVTWLSVLTFIIPALAGYFVYYAFLPFDTIGKWVYASLFASHSVGIVFPIIREMKITNTRFGVAVLASTVITDIASLVLFAICIQFKRHTVPSNIAGSISIFDHIDSGKLGFLFSLLFIFVILTFIFLSLLILPKIIQKIFIKFKPSDDAKISFFLACLLAIVFMGELIGLSVIVSSFIGGMVMVCVPSLHDNNRILHSKIEGIGYGFVIPFLFLTIGMKTDLRILVNAWENSLIVITTVFGLVGSKMISGWLALRLSGFDNKKSLCAGLMTVPQLSATIAAAAVALQLNMINMVFFNAIVCLSIVTTLPIPVLVKLLILKGNIRFNTIEDNISSKELIEEEISEDTL